MEESDKKPLSGDESGGGSRENKKIVRKNRLTMEP